MNDKIFIYTPQHSYSLFSREEFATHDPEACVSAYLDELNELSDDELSELHTALMAGFREFSPTRDDINLAVQAGLMTPAQALRAIPSEKRSAASRANGGKGDPERHRRGGRPRKSS